MMHRRHHCMPNHVMPANQVVYPTKCCEKHNHILNEVDHIHPSHTTIMNHHHVKNKHFFPHSESVVNTVDYENVNMGPGLPNQVSPMANGPVGPMGPGGPVGPMNAGPMGPNAVAGAHDMPMGMPCKPKGYR